MAMWGAVGPIHVPQSPNHQVQLTNISVTNCNISNFKSS